MEPNLPPLMSQQDFLQFLKSGGNAAMMVTVWIALKIRRNITTYIETLQTTLQTLAQSTTKLTTQLDQLHKDLAELRLFLEELK